MVFFIYKCYYVLFLFYSKYKKKAPWINAMFVLTASLGCLAMPFMIHLGMVDAFDPKITGESPSSSKGKLLFFIIVPLGALCWFVLHYVIFNLAKASKKVGHSERYTFIPTKKDKVICWFACSLVPFHYF